MVAAQPGSPEQPSYPDLYADGVRLTAAPFGFTLTFLLGDPDAEGASRVVGRVRMSPELAVAFGALLSDAIEKHRAEMAKRERESNQASAKHKARRSA